MKIKEIAWLAGVIEGEGCFSSCSTPTISLSMTDEDIVARVAKMFKRPYNMKSVVGNYKVQYRVNICGSDAVGWMFTIFSFMGYRRQSQMLAEINKWKSRPLRHNRDVFGCGDPRTPENTYRYKRTEFCKKCCNQRARDRQLRIKEIANG